MPLTGERTPTPEELRQERVMIQGLVVDWFLNFALLGVGIWAGSLTIGAEFLRGTVLSCLTMTGLYVLRRINRGMMAGYDFGTGKLEQVVGLMIAAAMLASAAYIGVSILDRFVRPPVTTQEGMSAGFVVVLVNFCVNVWFFISMTRASRGQVSPVVEAERHSWLGKVAASGVVVIVVALSALFRDHEIGRVADLAGSAFVATFMIWIAVSMFRDALPDLLDKALSEDLQVAINRTLATHFEQYDRLGAVRSRRVGNHMIVEIELGFAPDLALGTIEERLSSMQDDLRLAMPSCRIVLIPRVV